jgi:hypothetical protein
MPVTTALSSVPVYGMPTDRPNKHHRNTSRSQRNRTMNLDVLVPTLGWRRWIHSSCSWRCLLLVLLLLAPAGGGAVRLSSSAASSTGTTTPFSSTSSSQQRLGSGVFVPCTAPRFDLFADTLVGSWCDVTRTNKEEEMVAVAVDEVMRSCGGAVQGIREHVLVPRNNDNNNNDGRHQQPPLPQTTTGLYLNRADDGFIFWESGAYSFGPTTCGSDGGDLSSSSSSSSSSSHDERLWVSNFMMGPTSRLVLTTTTPTASSSNSINHDGEDGATCWNSTPSSFFLHKTAGTNLLKAPPSVVTFETKDPFLQTSVVWEQLVQCSMPRGAGGTTTTTTTTTGQSSTAAWNLPRAKWTRRRSEETAQSSGSGTSDGRSGHFNNDEAPLTCWVSVDQTVDSFVEWIGLASSYAEDLGLEQHDLDHGTLGFMGVQCPSNGQIQGMARIYNKGGTLSNVLFVQGTAVPHQ